MYAFVYVYVYGYVLYNIMIEDCLIGNILCARCVCGELLAVACVVLVQFLPPFLDELRGVRVSVVGLR